MLTLERHADQGTGANCIAQAAYYRIPGAGSPRSAHSCVLQRHRRRGFFRSVLKELAMLSLFGHPGQRPGMTESPH
jgi:hypothetical protein